MQPAPDDLSAEQQAQQPTPENVAARDERRVSRMGRLIRLRSWLTVLVGLLALGVVAAWLGLTR